MGALATTLGQSAQLPLPFGHSLELLAEGPLDFIRHRHPVDGNQRLQRQGAQLIQRGADLCPALLWIALLFEGLPDVLEEKLHELVGDRLAAALNLGDHGEGMIEGDACRDDALGGVEQGGEGRLVAVLVDRDERAGIDRALQGVVDLRAEASSELLAAERLGLLAVEVVDLSFKGDELLGGAEVVAQQPLDPLQVEAVGLQLLDHPQPVEVLGPVVADPVPHLWGGQQSPRPVRADVADRYPGFRGELFDRQLILGLGDRHCVKSITERRRIYRCDGI